jgi:hypothetical protein
MSITLPDDMQPLLTCTMLYSMRMQLPGLQSLTVAANDPLSWMRALGVHKELGKATQLTQLCLDINNTKDAVSSSGTTALLLAECCTSPDTPPCSTASHCLFALR